MHISLYTASLIIHTPMQANSAPALRLSFGPSNAEPLDMLKDLRALEQLILGLRTRMDTLVQSNYDLRVSLERFNTMGTILDELRGSVSRNAKATEAAIELIKGLSDRIKTASLSSDPAELRAVIAAIDQETEDLASAILANTPADPTVTPEAPTPPPVDQTPAPSEPDTPPETPPETPVDSTDVAPPGPDAIPKPE